MVDFSLHSSYIYRGAIQNKGFVFQPSLHLAGYDNLKTIIWANMDISSENSQKESFQFSEIKWQLGYEFKELLFGWDLEILAKEQFFPASIVSSPADALSRRELALKSRFAGYLNPSIAFYYGVQGVIKGQKYCELTFKEQIYVKKPFSLSFAAEAGYLELPSTMDAKGLSHTKGTLSLAFFNYSFGAHYVKEGDKKVSDLREPAVFYLSARVTNLF